MQRDGLERPEASPPWPWNGEGLAPTARSSFFHGRLGCRSSSLALPAWRSPYHRRRDRPPECQYPQVPAAVPADDGFPPPRRCRPGRSFHRPVGSRMTSAMVVPVKSMKKSSTNSTTTMAAGSLPMVSSGNPRTAPSRPPPSDLSALVDGEKLVHKARIVRHPAPKTWVAAQSRKSSMVSWMLLRPDAGWACQERTTAIDTDLSGQTGALAPSCQTAPDECRSTGSAPVSWAMAERGRQDEQQGGGQLPLPLFSPAAV